MSTSYLREALWFKRRIICFVRTMCLEAKQAKRNTHTHTQTNCPTVGAETTAEETGK